VVSTTLGVLIYGGLQRFRLLTGKENGERRHERRGCTSALRPHGPLIWVHAASNGEALSVLPIIQALHQGRPHLSFLVTSGTVTSAELLARRLPCQTYHQFVPYDVPQWLTRFLDHWRPDLFILIESELWPNMIELTAARHIPLILLNARLSEQSVRSWQWLKGTISTLLRRFDLILAQSEEHAERLHRLGALNVHVVGNIKFASQPLDYIPQDLHELEQQVRHRLLWVAASTHEGEEQAIIQAHHFLQDTFPNLLTILIPRHPQRACEILTLLRRHHLKVAQRSRGEKITDDMQIYLVDTSGELGLFYRLSEVVFLGGSLMNVGGHNLIEAALLDSAILHGPFMQNQQEMAALFQGADATLTVHTATELGMMVQRLLTEPPLRNALKQRARQVAVNQRQILAQTLTFLEPYVQALTPLKQCS
jgi:3-deoxy-D-manno-octulosonic-acid transferase